MNIIVTCSHCKKQHDLNIFNAKIQGPVIQVFCPFCKKKTIRNISKFIEKQAFLARKGLTRYETCAAVAALGRMMERELD